LKAVFGSDKVEPVPKGIRGADILQKIYDRRERYCGTIIWETKRDKRWKPEWLEKLKQDQRTVDADIPVLLTKTLPKNCDRFQQIKGVWVTNSACAIDLAIVLRDNLIAIATTKRAVAGKHSKMADLHDYLMSAGFQSRVESVVETFISMKDGLEQEKRAYERIWKKRERQIQRIVENIACMYGDLEGILDSDMLPIKNLELLAAADEEEE
jgi:hypothetical protein